MRPWEDSDEEDEGAREHDEICSRKVSFVEKTTRQDVLEFKERVELKERARRSKSEERKVGYLSVGEQQKCNMEAVSIRALVAPKLARGGHQFSMAAGIGAHRSCAAGDRAPQ